MLYTSRGEVVEDVCELEGTVTNVEGGCSVMVMPDVRHLLAFWLPRRVSSHHLWSCLSCQRRQRCTVRYKNIYPVFYLINYSTSHAQSKLINETTSSSNWEKLISPDGLELLFLEFLFRKGRKSSLSAFDGRSGGRFFLLKRMKLVDCLSSNRRTTVIVTDLGLLLVRLDRRQPMSACSGASEAEFSVLCSVLCHSFSAKSFISIIPMDKINFNISEPFWNSNLKFYPLFGWWEKVRTETKTKFRNTEPKISSQFSNLQGSGWVIQLLYTILKPLDQQFSQII